jgi:hypothetical protein
MISELNDPGMPQQVAEVTDGKQEWEIRDIISKEAPMARDLFGYLSFGRVS